MIKCNFVFNMGRSKLIIKHIPLLYKTEYIDVVMFNFVMGIIAIRPEFKKTNIIEMFAKVFRLDETYSIENELNNYNRILHKFLDALKVDESGHLFLLYKSQYTDNAMFGFVLGITTLRPDYKIDVAIKLFANTYHLGTTYIIENEVSNYDRMLIKFNEEINKIRK